MAVKTTPDAKLTVGEKHMRSPWLEISTLKAN